MINVKFYLCVGKQSKVLTDSLRYFFETSSNPYISLLQLINIISEDRIKGKASTIIHTSEYILYLLNTDYYFLTHFSNG